MKRHQRKQAIEDFARMIKEEAPANWSCYSVEELVEMAESGEFGDELDSWLEYYE